VRANGQIALTDCGIRRCISGGGLVAARNLAPDRYDYVAPEVASGALEPDTASDLYALGCLIYRLILGRPPFLGGDAARKCASHRAGQLPNLQQLGIEVRPEVRWFFAATIEPDRSRRLDSYVELINRLSPIGPKAVRCLRAELRRKRYSLCALPSMPCARPRVRPPNRLIRWLAVASIAACAVLALFHGGTRWLPVLSFPMPADSRTARQLSAGFGQARPRLSGPAEITSLWNATEDLRHAFRESPPHRTITLQSPGPFLMDALTIDKPITLRGAPGVRPLFLGGPGSALRITASQVRLENMHFVRVTDPITGQSRRDAEAMVECSGSGLLLADCSFQAILPGEPAACAIQWRPGSEAADGQHLALEGRNLLFRQVSAGVSVAGTTALRVALDNCTHLGPGPLISSQSERGEAFESVDIELSRVTVYAAGTLVQSFAHPVDEMVPIRIRADQCLLVPRHREQPILTVRYAAPHGLLMPKVTWSGAETVCPADATMLEVTRGADATPWRAPDVAAWKAYWGAHDSGVLGVRAGFAGTAPAVPTDVPRVIAENRSPPGCDSEALSYPLPITLEQLPLLLERLAPPQ
jgi:hypothetical protein